MAKSQKFRIKQEPIKIATKEEYENLIKQQGRKERDINIIKLKDFLIRLIYEMHPNSKEYRDMKLKEIEEIFR